MVDNGELVGGFNLPLWKMMEVNWDDDIPNMMGKIQFMLQTTNQIYMDMDVIILT